MSNRFLSAFALCTILAVQGAQAQDVQETVIFDLTDRDAFDQCTQYCDKYDHDEYPAWSWNISHPQMYNYELTDGHYSDYFTTPQLDLKAGELYVVHTSPECYTYNNTTTLTVLLGNSTQVNETKFTVLKKWSGIPYISSGSDPAEAREITFFVPEDGKYRISFLGEPYSLSLKQTTIASRGVVGTPKSPEDFTVIADPDGALKVDISFTMPTQKLSGDAITEPLTYRIYRQAQVAKTGTANPGEKVTYSENVGLEGEAIYGLEVALGDDATPRQTVKTFVGKETPLAPATAAFSAAGSKYLVSWEAPIQGAHGATLVADRLRYKVTRYLDDVATVVAQSATGTSFEDSFTSDGLHLLHYGVVAIYGDKQSDETATASAKIGTAKLPFSDSFAGAKFNDLWDHEIIDGRTGWQAAAEIPNAPAEQKGPSDGDGGLAFYNSYNEQKGHSARLITPPFAYTEGDNIIVSFMMFHDKRGNKTKEGVQLQISRDLGEWTDVEGGYISLRSNDLTGWKQYNISLSAALAQGCTSFRVAFQSISEYGYNMAIDAVNIFRMLNKDVAVSALSMPASIIAGNSLEIKMKVANNGTTDLAADAYSIALDSDFPDDIEMPATVAIPSLGSHEYTFTVPVNSLHAENSLSYTFTGKATLVGDEDAANNSATASTTLGFSTGNSATELSGTYDTDSKTYTLSWTPAKDLTYTPVNLVESFEGFENNALGPWNGWTTVDMDGRDGGNWYGASGPIFKVSTYNGTPGKRDGKNIISVTSYGKQDDWVISPKINCKAFSSMQLKFLVSFKKSDSSRYTCTVYYTTDDKFNDLNPADNFTTSVFTKQYNGTYLKDEFFEVTVDKEIPAEAKYVAINITSNNSYSGSTSLDNIRLTEVNKLPLQGYRIYSLVNGCLTEELVSSETATHNLVLPAAQAALLSTSNEVFVTAVYPDGEAPRSNLLNLDVVSGVENVLIDAPRGKAEYFDLNGRLISHPAPGSIYILRQDGTARKVLIK